MPDLPGFADADEVKRNRKKLVAIRRAERRLLNRLADIDWEFDELLPELREFESTMVTVKPLPSTRLVDDGSPDA